MTIPTQEIQALRDRAQEALDPLPYQKVRLQPVLRCDRPVRFAAVEVNPDLIVLMFHEVKTGGGNWRELDPLRREAINSCRVATWPAALIVELCDAVLERRAAQKMARMEAVATHFDAGTVAAPGTPGRLKAALLGLPFVDSVQVEENCTLDTVDGMPPKSVRVTIGPPMLRYGALEEIARVLHRWLPVGVATVGSAGLHTPGLDYNWNWAEPHCGDDLADSFALAVKAVKGPGGQPAPGLCSDCKGPRRGSLACERCSMVAVGGVPLHLASGEDLDRLGELVGVERACDTDRQYRAHIKLEATDGRYLGAATRPMAKVGAIDGVKVGGVDFGHEPASPPTVSTFEMTENGPALTGVREATPDEVAEMKATFEAAEPDGRIHYTDEPPRALKEGFDKAARREEARQAKRELVQIDSTVKGERYVGYVIDDPVSKPDPRERLRREMTKGRW